MAAAQTAKFRAVRCIVAYSFHVSRGSCVCTFREDVMRRSYISCGFLRRENAQILWKSNLKQHIFTSFGVLHGQGSVMLQLETQLHNNNNNNNNNNNTWNITHYT